MATLTQRGMRRNLAALFRLFGVLLLVIVVNSVLFHFLMQWEGQNHSWITGVYWTLTVMTTLGFGDITFHTDLGRGFSILVLMSGVILLLIVLPFSFIRYFYAPWLEAQIHITVPRELPEGTRGHVILCRMDPLAEALIPRLALLDVPYVVLEPDAARAVTLHGEGVTTLVGQRDRAQTYRDARVTQARLVVANLDDAINTSIALTVRELAPGVPIAAIADDSNAVDILRLAGADHVIPVKGRLGEQLAARVTAGRRRAQVIGRHHGLLIAEFTVADTPLAGATVRGSRLRELTGLNLLGVWERGELRQMNPDAPLSEHAVAVVAGTQEGLASLDEMFGGAGGEGGEAADESPVMVLGGGKVGRAAARALRARGVRVELVDKNPALRERLERIADRVVIGDAADIEVMREAGIRDTPSVVLTTHEDASNIYLALYCRRLNPDARIVSRIMYNRNLEAIHRAGADFVLGETALAVRSVLAVLQGRELVVVGEEVDIFTIPVPPALRDKTLRHSGIGSKTGLNVIGVGDGDADVEAPQADAPLRSGQHLLTLGTQAQREAFARAFEA